MAFIVFLFIGGTCVYVASKIMSSEERNKVFNKFPIQVENVKEYNNFCAKLVIGFGVAAEATMIGGQMIGGIFSLLSTVLLILEAYITMKIYSKGEKKMLKKR